MPQFKELYVAAEAAQALYQQYGHHPESLRAWLVAEVAYLEARGITLFREPSAAPITFELTSIFLGIATSLCDYRQRHYHGLRVAA